MTTGLLVQILRKMFLSLRSFKNANTSRFAPCRIRLKMCVEMKEQAQAHYFETIVAIPVPV